MIYASISFGYFWSSGWWGFRWLGINDRDGILDIEGEDIIEVDTEDADVKLDVEGLTVCVVIPCQVAQSSLTLLYNIDLLLHLL